MPEAVKPEERVERRSDIYNRYNEVFGVDRPAAQQYEQDKLLRQSGQQTLQAIKQGGSGLQKVATETEKAAQMLPVQQAQETSQQAMAGQQMGSDIALTKRAQAAQSLKQKMDVGLQELAQNIAQTAFEKGLDAKQLIFHQNEVVSDLAFNQMFEDFKAGRTTKQEVENIYRNLKYDAQQKEIRAKEMMKTVLGEFNYFMQQGNVDRAKARLKEALDAQKEALAQAARAQNTAAILKGTFKILGLAVKQGNE